MKSRSLRVITVTAMLIALSVTIGIVCKNYLTVSVYYRITFENLPLILAGLLFGPLVGAAAGAVSDVVSCLCSTNPSVNPIITLGAASVGLIAGVFAKRFAADRSAKTLVTAVTLPHLVGQVIIKSVGKIIVFGMPWWGTFVGLAVSVLVGTTEFFILKRLLLHTNILNKFGSNS